MSTPVLPVPEIPSWQQIWHYIISDNTRVALLVAALGIMLLGLLHQRDLRRRDPQRFFDPDQRRVIRQRAGFRCEHKSVLGRRCTARGAHADHVVPWSKGGPTTVWNAQWLCAKHNYRKSDLMPSRFYRWRLNHRRSHYATRSAHESLSRDHLS